MVPFVYLASVCRSLQCLISALTQAGGGDLLFRFTSSVQSCCGEGGAQQTNVTGACGEHSPCSGHTGFAPAHRCVCFPCLHCSGSWLLYMEHALRCMQFQFSGIPQKRGLSCACILCLPQLSNSGSQELDRHALPGCGAPSLLCSPSFSFRLRLSGACALCLAATLLADVDHPEAQEVFG